MSAASSSRAVKTHCVRGHERTPDNVRANGGCAECDRLRKRAERARRGAAPRGRASVEDRFWRYVDQTLWCWTWRASTDGKGYGRISIDGRYVPAHRYAYELLVGPIPDGLQLDHLCRVRQCVNPSHLEPVTSRENTLRGVGPAALNAVKTHCPRGHEYSPENTLLDRRGGRQCRTCERRRIREYAAARRKAAKAAKAAIS